MLSTGSVQRGFGEARGTVGCRAGAIGDQRLDCSERQAGFGGVAETRETGLSTRAGYAGGPEVSADIVPILPALYQPSRLSLGGGGCPRKPQAGLLESRGPSRNTPGWGTQPGSRPLPVGPAEPGHVAHLAVLSRVGRRHPSTQLQFRPLVDPSTTSIAFWNALSCGKECSANVVHFPEVCQEQPVVRAWSHKA